MAFIAAHTSVLRGRPPVRAGGMIGFSRATPHPADRSDTRHPRAGKSDGAPPSTSLLAIAVGPVAGHIMRSGAALRTFGSSS